MENDKVREEDWDKVLTEIINAIYHLECFKEKHKIDSREIALTITKLDEAYMWMRYGGK